MKIELPRDPNWLVQLLCQGAEKANGYYEKLIAHYDIQRGVVDPPAGLDRVAKRIVAEMIRYAYLSYAAVLGRAIEEANVHAPDVGLTAATLLAAVQVPAKVLARRIADAEERRTIERIYDELLATGTVEKNLSEDDRAVRELHAQEVLAARPRQPEVSKVFPFKPRERVVTRVEQARPPAGGDAPRRPSHSAARCCAARAGIAPAAALRRVADDYDHPGADAARCTEHPAREPPAPRTRAGLADRLERVTRQHRDLAARTITMRCRRMPTPRGQPRFYLTPDQVSSTVLRSGPRRPSGCIRMAS